ncbi:hypothetical protein ACFLTE_07790 [Bacteroidota bacterium]
MKRSIFVLPVCFLIYMACEKVTLEPETIDTSAGILYSEIQEIFDNNCISCHSGGQPPNLSEGNSYQALVSGSYIDNPTDYTSTKLYSTLEGSHKSRITDTDKQKIGLWLEQGGEEKYDSNAVIFIDYIDKLQPIFNNNCIECHHDRRDPDLRDGGSYLSLLNGGYISDPINFESTTLYIALQETRHTSIISEDTLNIIYNWLKSGAEEPVLVDTLLNIEYGSDIQVVFNNTCVTCHNGTQDPDLTDSNSYQALIDGLYIANPTNYEATKLYKELIGDHLFTASYSELKTIFTWLAKGAEGPPEPIDPTVDISFANDIQPIFTNKCASCHPSLYVPDLSEGNAYAALSDGGYIDNPTDYESTELYMKIDDSEGSHDGRANETDKQLIATWLQQEAQDN